MWASNVSIVAPEYHMWGSDSERVEVMFSKKLLGADLHGVFSLSVIYCALNYIPETYSSPINIR